MLSRSKVDPTAQAGSSPNEEAQGDAGGDEEEGYSPMAEEHLAKAKAPKRGKAGSKAGKKGAGAAEASSTAAPAAQPAPVVDDDTLDAILANDPHYGSAFASINRALDQAGPDAGPDELLAASRVDEDTPAGAGASSGAAAVPAVRSLRATLRAWRPIRGYTLSPHQPLLVLDDHDGRLHGWEGHGHFGHVPIGSKDGRSVHLLLEPREETAGGGGPTPLSKTKGRGMRSSRALTRATRSSKALLPAAEPMEVTFTYDGVSQVAIPWEPKSLAKVARQVKDVELLCGLRERLQTWKAHRDDFIKTPFEAGGVGGSQAVVDAEELKDELAKQLEKETELKDKLDEQMDSLRKVLDAMKERQAERGNGEGEGEGGGGDAKGGGGGGAGGIMGLLMQGEGDAQKQHGKSRLASGLKWERLEKTPPKGALGLTWQRLAHKPAHGFELKNEGLKEALRNGTSKFEQGRFDAFGVGVGLEWQAHTEKPLGVKMLTSSALSSKLASSGGRLNQPILDALLPVPGLSRDCCVEASGQWYTPIVDPRFDWDCFIDAGSEEDGGYVERWFAPLPMARELKAGTDGAADDIAELQARLGQGVLEFDKAEWDDMKLTVCLDHYVRASDGYYCVPDRAQPTPWARERSHVYKKCFFSAWRVLVVQLAVEAKLKLDDKRQKVGRRGCARNEGEQLRAGTAAAAAVAAAAAAATFPHPARSLLHALCSPPLMPCPVLLSPPPRPPPSPTPRRRSCRWSSSRCAR